MDSQTAREETSRTLAVPGATLHVVEVGAGRRPLVMLHGGPGASHDYLRPQLDALLDVAARYWQAAAGELPEAALPGRLREKVSARTPPP